MVSKRRFYNATNVPEKEGMEEEHLAEALE
jgi:hypothetical protein